jgi:uncharacterized membrane protein
VADPQQNDDSNQLTDIKLERLKMYQDSFKHMTTFSSGAILLSAAVTGALFPKPVLVGFLRLSIGLLALGAGAAMFGLLNVAIYMDSAIDIGGEEEHTSRILYTLLWLSVGVALVGVMLFAVFALANLGP